MVEVSSDLMTTVCFASQASQARLLTFASSHNILCVSMFCDVKLSERLKKVFGLGEKSVKIKYCMVVKQITARILELVWFKINFPKNIHTCICQMQNKCEKVMCK